MWRNLDILLDPDEKKDSFWRPKFEKFTKDCNK